MKKAKNEFVSNLIGLGSVNVLNLIIPIITMPILSRALGGDGYGIVLLFSSVTIFMMIIIDYSVNINGVRDVALNPNSLESIYIRFQGVRCLFGMVYFPLAVLYCYYNISEINFNNIVELLFVSIIGYYFMAPWFHQGTGTLIFFSGVSTVLRLLQILLIIIFVKDRADLLYALRINAYVFLVNGVLLYLYRKFKFDFSFSIINPFKLKEIKNGFGNFIGDFSPNLYSNLPPLILGGLVSSNIFASYSLALRLINVAGSFQSIICRSMYPIAAKRKINVNAFLLINIVLSLVPIIFILTSSDFLIEWFLGNGFDEAALFLKLGTLGILFYAISSSLMFAYVLPNNHDALFRKISLFSSIVPAIVGYPLIYLFGALGAISMFIFARFCFAILYLFNYLKLK